MTNFVLTQQYESSSESDEDMEINQEHVQERKTARRKFKWVEDKSFHNDLDAEMAIKQERQWSRYYSNKGHDGIKVYYRCNRVKFRGKQCSASIYLYYPNDSNKVVLFRSTSEHDHTESDERKVFSEEAKQIIVELFDLRLKPKKIYELLQDRNYKISRNQVNNYLTHLRRKKLGPSTLSLGELEALCSRRSTMPECEDESFVVSYIVSYEDDDDNDDDVIEDGNKFRFFLSTKRLLTTASSSTRLHADATYKLNWQGFPVLVIGTSDYNRKLHPFGLAVCTDEKQPDFEFIFKSISDGVERVTHSNYTPEALTADGSGAIRNAYIHIFDNNKVVMCWAHMRRNVNKKLSIVKNKETTQEILDDIDQLQLCESEKVFRNASSLFLKKWISREEEFSTYFETEWLQNLNSWYEGYNIFTSSTNNALEATNRVIKDEHTFRERQPLSRFFTIANDIVHNWSKARNPNQSDPVVFSTEPTITLKKWTDAYHFAKSSKSVLEQP